MNQEETKGQKTGRYRSLLAENSKEGRGIYNLFRVHSADLKIGRCRT